MNARWMRWLTTVLVIFLSCPLPPPAQAAKTKSTKTKKKSPPVETQERTWLPAEMTFGFQTRDSETEGLGDLLVPLWNPGGKGLLFVNPRATLTDNDEEEGNLGVGYRQLLGSQVILGANAYYDYRDVDSNHYDQWGVGFEILSTWIDARANYYDAGDDENIVDSRTETSTSQSSQTTTRWSDPYALDHYILQDYATTRTLTTVTTSRTFEQFEAAYGGYDWEIGLRLPIKSTALEARLFGGYYDFDRDFAADVRGWKTRAELRVLSTLFLDAGLYENDELTGSDWFAGARLTVPLDLAKIARGRNPFATAKSRLAHEPRDLSARLTEMVMRDSQIRIETSDFIENESLATEEITRKSSTDRDTYVMMSDVNFVDGDDGAATGDGTAEQPFATIQQGVDAVFGSRNVYVYNAASAYVENVVLTPGVRLWGSGVLVPGGVGGATFGSGIAPIVDGGGTGPAITLADGTTVLGFRIQNTCAGGPGVFVNLPVRGLTDVSCVGILGNGVTDLTILDNVISGNGIGVLLARQGDFLLDFENNLVSGNAANGMEVWTAGNSGTSEVFIAGSTYANNGGDGLQIYNSTYDRSLVLIQDSQFLNNGGDGLQIAQLNSDWAGTGLLNVLADGNAGSGFDLRTQDNDLYLAAVTGSAFTANSGDGMSFLSSGNVSAEIEIDNSRFANNDQNGLLYEAYDGGTDRLYVAASSFTNNGANGLLVQSTNRDLLAASVADSEFAANGANGLAADVADGGLFGLFADASSFDGNAANGMAVNGADLDLGLVMIQDGAFRNNAQAGAAVAMDSTDVAILEIFGAQAEGNGGNGIDVAMDDAGFVGVGFTNVSANQNAQMGVEIAVQNADEAQVILLGSQASRNGADGLAVDLTGVDDSMIFVQNATFDQNAGHGIFTTQTISDEASAQLSGVQANNNASVGIEIAQSATDLSTARVSDSVADDNAGLGLMLAQGNTFLAVAAVDGLQANGNASGLYLHQTDVGIALANVSGSCADENAQFGMWILQNSDLASINVVGMPDGLAASIDGIAGLLGLDLPDEILPFLGPSGGVSASGNGVSGLRTTIHSDGLLALNGLFDVTANDNVIGDGISASTIAFNGIGVNLLGSSENWADIFQLGTQIGDLFDVDLPLALAGDGHLQANGNGACGILISSFGDLAAVNLTVGAEASGNGVAGMASISTGGEIGIDAVVRLEALDNANYGLYQSVFGGDLAAIGLLADINASGNGTEPLSDGGIYSHVFSPNGVAALLAFSSDALRPAAAFLGDEFLGAPFEIPGDPFGPVVASDNVGFGFQAEVEGDVAAVAALLDVQANNNSTDGINLALLSDDGVTASLLASSDLLYDVLPGAFGANPIAGAGLGPVTANGNGGGGIVIEQIGAGPAISLLAGVEANNNVADDGILATLTADNSFAGAFLVDVEASGNAAGRGIDLDLTGYDDVLAGLVYVTAEDNGQQGIRVTGNSGDADAYALLAGIDANRNGLLGSQAGIVVDLTAAEDASAALTDVYARDNTGRGANVLLDAGGDANLFAGDFAADDLDAIYGFSGDLGPLFGLIPTGNDVFSDNGSGGLHAELTSAAGNALVGISGVNADYNGNAGFNLTLNALNGNAMASLQYAYANDNGGNGINLSLSGGGGVADVLVSHVGVNGNGANGLQITDDNYNGPVGVLGSYISATSNDGNGVRLAMSGLAGAPNLDFGGGGDSLGQSSFYANGNRDFRYNNGGGATVMAENNFWGADLDPVANGQTAGSIDANPWLPAAP